METATKKKIPFAKYDPAESIIAALKANDELDCEGIDAVYCPSLHPGCPGDPDNCNLCLNRKCEADSGLSIT